MTATITTGDPPTKPRTASDETIGATFRSGSVRDETPDWKWLAGFRGLAIRKLPALGSGGPGAGPRDLAGTLLGASAARLRREGCVGGRRRVPAIGRRRARRFPGADQAAPGGLWSGSAREEETAPRFGSGADDGAALSATLTGLAGRRAS